MVKLTQQPPKIGKQIMVAIFAIKVTDGFVRPFHKHNLKQIHKYTNFKHRGKHSATPAVSETFQRAEK